MGDIFPLTGSEDIGLYDNRPTHNIVGAGMSGIMTALYLLRHSKKSGTPIKINIINSDLEVGFRKGSGSSAGIVASLTPDEDLVTVKAESAEEFRCELLEDCKKYGLNPEDIGLEEYLFEVEKYFDQTTAKQRKRRAEIIGQTGRIAMEGWDKLYKSDSELAIIMDESGFQNPLETKPGFLFGIEGAGEQAEELVQYCNIVMRRSDAHIVSPTEAIKRHPYLRAAFHAHSTLDNSGILQWNNDCHCTESNGGCIIPEIFLPKLLQYLQNTADESRSTVAFLGGTTVTELNKDGDKATGIKVENSDGEQTISISEDRRDTVIIAPGSNCKFLKEELPRPTNAHFAGVTLVLDISPEMIAELEEGGVALPSQKPVPMDPYYKGPDGKNMLVTLVAFRDREIGALHIGVGGEKAFYGTQNPTLEDLFIKDALLQHAKTICTIYPEVFAKLLGKKIDPKEMTHEHVQALVSKGVARPWAGSRPVSSRTTPIIGMAPGFSNVIVEEGMGSGGAAKATVNSDLTARYAMGLDLEELEPYALVCDPSELHEIPDKDYLPNIRQDRASSI